jgi:HEPN domain-containing protein
MDKERQVAYWQESSREDFITGKILFEKERYLHGLFFCHLSVEKLLKALFVKSNNTFAPKTHNIIYLYDQCGLESHEERRTFYAILMKYQISGRYPDSIETKPRPDLALEYLEQTERELTWLMNQLENL